MALKSAGIRPTMVTTMKLPMMAFSFVAPSESSRLKWLRSVLREIGYFFYSARFQHNQKIPRPHARGVKTGPAGVPKWPPVEWQGADACCAPRLRGLQSMLSNARDRFKFKEKPCCRLLQMDIPADCS
jgi:hypothetical protein